MTAKLVVLPYEILWFWFEPIDAYHVDVACPAEELRVLSAHSMRHGHHELPRPGGMTRLDPVR